MHKNGTSPVFARKAYNVRCISRRRDQQSWTTPGQPELSHLSIGTGNAGLRSKIASLSSNFKKSWPQYPPGHGRVPIIVASFLRFCIEKLPNAEADGGRRRRNGLPGANRFIGLNFSVVASTDLTLLKLSRELHKRIYIHSVKARW